MRALTLYQPWASLVVLGTKVWETRSWPAPKSVIGQRVAFHAAKRKPGPAEEFGDWQTQPDGAAGWSMRHKPTAVMAGLGQNLLATLYPKAIGGEYGYVPLPLGAIVGSGVIARSLPIEACSDDKAHICRTVTGELLLHEPISHSMVLESPRGAIEDTEYDIGDQLPYGDFTSGRWAWELSDVAATTERCPWCWGIGYEYEEPPGSWCLGECPACKGEGKCDPIPAKGKQGWWNWTVDE